MTTLVKTFRAADARSALAAVKAALGPDAIILSTAQVTGSLFRKGEIEVIAALHPQQPPAPTAQAAAKYLAPSPPEGASVMARELTALRTLVEGLRTELFARPAPAPADPRFPREVMAQLNHLLERGVEASIAEELLRRAIDATGLEAPDRVWKAVRSALAQRLVPAPTPWLKGPRRVLALIGPTGVGKTTTLAKIAGRAVVEARAKVAMITVDTYRIGASEQVAGYGSIMKVPTKVARDAAELRRAIAAFADAELVLIDTAGRSKAEEIDAQARMLRAVPGVQLALCLSAATGGRELGAAAARYARQVPEQLIFTRLDEAVAPGSVLSALEKIGRPVACVTNGQRVPEDLHSPTAAQLVELVAGRWTP